jgi:hypothetical protein
MKITTPTCSTGSDNSCRSRPSISVYSLNFNLFSPGEKGNFYVGQRPKADQQNLFLPAALIALYHKLNHMNNFTNSAVSDSILGYGKESVLTGKTAQSMTRMSLLLLLLLLFLFLGLI